MSKLPSCISSHTLTKLISHNYLEHFLENKHEVDRNDAHPTLGGWVQVSNSLTVSDVGTLSGELVKEINTIINHL